MWRWVPPLALALLSSSAGSSPLVFARVRLLNSRVGARLRVEPHHHHSGMGWDLFCREAARRLRQKTSGGGGVRIVDADGAEVLSVEELEEAEVLLVPSGQKMHPHGATAAPTTAQLKRRGLIARQGAMWQSSWGLCHEPRSSFHSHAHMHT